MLTKKHKQDCVCPVMSLGNGPSSELQRSTVHHWSWRNLGAVTWSVSSTDGAEGTSSPEPLHRDPTLHKEQNPSKGRQHGRKGWNYHRHASCVCSVAFSAREGAVDMTRIKCCCCQHKKRLSRAISPSCPPRKDCTLLQH